MFLIHFPAPACVGAGVTRASCTNRQSSPPAPIIASPRDASRRPRFSASGRSHPRAAWRTDADPFRPKTLALSDPPAWPGAHRQHLRRDQPPSSRAPGSRPLHPLAQIYRFGRHLTPSESGRSAQSSVGPHRDGPDRDAVNFDLDDPEICLGLVHRFALGAKSGRRYYGIHHRRHKLSFFCFGMTARCFSQLTAPAEQLLRRQSMPSRYRADRVATP